MGDSHSSSSTEKYKKIASSFFNSPRLLFTPKSSHETETMMSPTSILDNKPFSALKNPFWSETNSPKTPGRCWDKLESKGVGLVGIVDEKKHDEVNSKKDTRMVLFGSQLKIQIPPLLLSPPTFSSPVDLSIKKEISHLGSFFENSNSSLRVLSASEMELSEDYTRVICHGPNPRTTHIFDNCVIETSCFASDFDKESGCFSHPIATSSYLSQSFLSVCFYCNKNLGQGQDIYMYR